MTRHALYAVLAGAREGVIGTVSPAGRPQAALVGLVVTPALEVVFETLDTSRKYRNLQANPAVSFVIRCPGSASVQYEGWACVLKASVEDEYHNRYLRHWPEAQARQHWPGLVCVVTQPVWIRHTDASRAPHGHAEFDFGAVRTA